MQFRASASRQRQSATAVLLEGEYWYHSITSTTTTSTSTMLRVYCMLSCLSHPNNIFLNLNLFVNQYRWVVNYKVLYWGKGAVLRRYDVRHWATGLFHFNPYAGGGIWPTQNDAKTLKNDWNMGNGYSSERTQQELSIEYQYDRVYMVFKRICIPVLWTKVALEFEGLNISKPPSLKWL